MHEKRAVHFLSAMCWLHARHVKLITVNAYTTACNFYMIILTGCRNIYLKPRTCPHESGKASPNPLIFLSVSSGLSPFVWVPTSLGDWSCARINQVRFKCLSTPMRGPNNKPLAFVVHGSHSYELAGFLSIAFLGRLASNGRLLGSLSLINRSFCSKKYNGERLRQCESGAW